MKCENCKQIVDEVFHIEETVPTVFCKIDLDTNVCKICKSSIEYSIMKYIELHKSISKKIYNQANQLRDSTKKNMK